MRRPITGRRTSFYAPQYTARMHFLLLYRDLVPDYVARRESLRGAHLAH
ncbi:hypothetical protein IHN59_10545, partial [Deinococcus sp. 23YEL01]|nr:hypothetical protein [Deinococcus sp. 23YEL01]